MKHGKTIALVYERHDQDSRYKELKEISETVSTKYGTGGGNMPIVVEKDRVSVEEINVNEEGK